MRCPIAARATTAASCSGTSTPADGTLRRTCAAALGVLAALAAQAALAQPFPARPIRFIVPVPPGGGADFVARLLAPRVSEVLGQSVVVDNRAGGNATIGAEFVARAAPDGHTWLLATSQHTVTPAIMRKIPYDIATDFAPVTLMARAPQLLTVHPAVPARSVKELIALARSRRGQLNYGSGGIGSASHLSAEVFRSMAKIEIVHIPYKGVGLAFGDLVGGQLDFMFPAIPSGVPYHRAGRLRALGVTSLTRHPSIPELPTLAEAALPGYAVNSWYGIVVPAGTRAEIVNRINAAFVGVLKLPEVKAALVAQGSDAAPGTPEQFARLIKDDLARNAKIVQAAGVSPE
jgi:tripartite-type tricarboxylate transporter receptor subunit TctC